jgi:hypothetical protein
MDAINQAGFFEKNDKIFALHSPFLLSNSIFNLLAEINAISIPEKKAENVRDRKIKKTNVKVIY